MIKANTKNGVKTNNIPIQVINMIKPPNLFVGPAYIKQLVNDNCRKEYISYYDTQSRKEHQPIEEQLNNMIGEQLA